MGRTNIKIAPALAAIVVLMAFSSCIQSAAPTPQSLVPSPQSPFSSYRDIPGVTAEEIAAIEALQREHQSVNYGMTMSTEAFLTENASGKYVVGGYTALLCEWLGELFGIQFQPEVYVWNDLLEKLNSGDLDCAGNLIVTEERLQMYHMTDAIAQRQYKMMRLKGSPDLDRIAMERPLRYAFLAGAVHESNVASVTTPGMYEPVWVNDYTDVYGVLKSGAADAFIAEDAMEASFAANDGFYMEDFLPLIYTSVSMATAKAEFEPVISLVTKALQNGARPYLSHLFNLGNEAYKKHNFFTLLTEAEKAYLQNTVSVPMAYQYFNYPIAFYDFHTNKWDGISIDILHEVEKLAGFTFDIINDEHTEMPELIAMLSDGRAHIFCDLIYSTQRAPLFIWNKNKFMSDQYALVSKVNYPNLNINEIPFTRVSLIRSTAHEEMFRTWFPEAIYATQYANSDDAFLALEHDEVDHVMVSKSKLLWYSNYYEFSGYKANFLFNYFYESAFAFNKEQTVLCSVVDKAVSVIDTSMITEQWLSKTYDFRARLLEAQRPWLIGGACLLFVMLGMVLFMFYQKRSEGKRLKKIVAEQTAALTATTEEAKSASKAKTHFLANMSHEMRTPMNVIIGLTDLMLEEDDVPVKIRENLKKIDKAGNTLMSLISDVLDISKVEAGKMELMLEEYDVPSMLNDIIILNIIRIEEKPITFKLEIDEKLPCTLFGDDLRIKQILNNLLSNAFKYTHEGTVTLNVKCQSEGTAPSSPDPRSPFPVPPSLWITFSIIDTGIGIRKDDIDKLFTDYNQVDTKANRRIEGTGLGLSIIKRFVGLMDGDISVESEHGKGSTFRVRIRQGYVSDKTIGKEGAENLSGFRYTDEKNREQKKLIRPDLSYARVLVVDDFTGNLDVAVGMMHKYKMHVDCVTSGQEAIDHIAAGKPVYDAVFMDHMMPGMDGIEAVKLTRALGTEYAKKIPIIALTANAVAGSEQMFLNSGFNAFISKPFNVMTLDSVIQKWVRDKSRE
jgi:signal transduction histidine kinase